MTRGVKYLPLFFSRVFGFAMGFLLLNLGPELLGGAQTSPYSSALYFVGGVLIALVLGWILPRTRLVRPDLVVVTWLSLFVIHLFNNMLEGYFFSNVFSTVSVFVSGVLFSLLITLVEALIAGVLFAAERPERRLIPELSNYFAERTHTSSLWRIAVASAAYFPVYFAFGVLISPFVIPYYTDPSLGLVIPPFTVIIPLELLRGFLYVVALLPIIATIKETRRTVYFGVVSLLYIPGALVPLMVQPLLPVNIVPIHAVEILADSIVHGAVITRLLARRSK